MPKKAKATEPEVQTSETNPAEAKPVTQWGGKTAAIKQALIDNPTKSPKDIAEIVTQQGFETNANYVSGVKAKVGGKKRKKAKAAAAPATETTGAVPALPKDAISVALLQKAKKLASQFSSVKEAKTAIDALAQILD